jgi:hypothetical protein
VFYFTASLPVAKTLGHLAEEVVPEVLERSRSELKYSLWGLMPTLMPTRTTPGGIWRTHRFFQGGEIGLFMRFRGRRGTTRT